ncbi:SseB family protein [Catellatospora tritici]|uniref:SseB family protein n=1 Tax=Catellatospora tritici TaxID=2851566 RepID=UPI0020C30B92
MGWQPANDIEIALLEALHAGDQEQYFRVLSRCELILPVAAENRPGAAPGWGTWVAEGRTHVLSFTSASSMRTCLAEHAGPARRIAFQELAAAWPNHEWWLAVNPGLPIEGYLPAWFVTQMVRGDVRIAGAPAEARGRLERLEALERAKAARSAMPPPQRPVHPPAPVGDPTIVDAEVIEVSDHPPAIAARRTYEPPPLPAAPPPPLPPYEPIPSVPAPAPVPPSVDMWSGPTTQPVAPPVAPVPLPDPAPSVDREPQTDPEPSGGRYGQAPRREVPAGSPRHVLPTDEPDFTPSNSVEEQLLDAAEAGNTDAFLSTLLLATVLVPTAGPGSPQPGEEGFAWQPTDIDGEPHIVSFTSAQCMPAPGDVIPVRFIKLIKTWPDPAWSFAVNPGTPIGASLPGDQLLELARWAGEMGLGGEEREAVMPAPTAGAAPPPTKRDEVTEMQKVIAGSQVGYYLERGYDRVSGFVHRAREVGHLRGPQALRGALGLTWAGSPFKAEDTEIFVLRWPAYRPSLYRIPYGGQHEAAMRAMEGWVIERAPFRGNGFAPGDSTEIIAEFKVDSIRLPHGARLLRVDAEGKEEMVAVLDADGPRWLRTDGGE